MLHNSNSNQPETSFPEQIKFIQKVLTHHQTSDLPIYQETAMPYEYYFAYPIDTNLELQHYYRSLSTINETIVPVAYSQPQNQQKSLFSFFGLGKNQQNRRTNLYFKYYTHRLEDWISLIRQRAGFISYQNILYILKNILTLARDFTRTYLKTAKNINTNNFYVNNFRTLQIYPFTFGFIDQQSTEVQTPKKSYKNLHKQSPTTYQSTSHCRAKSIIDDLNKIQYITIDDDLKDIFLVIMELLTFRKSNYFFSQKHQRIKWDLVKQFLSSPSVTGHLSEPFLMVLYQIVEGRIMTCQALQSRIVDLQLFQDASLYLDLSVKSELMSARQIRVQQKYQRMNRLKVTVKDMSEDTCTKATKSARQQLHLLSYQQATLQ